MPRVLVVDDDAAIRALLVDLLVEEGYEVVAASNGAEGVTLARAAHPDVIMMDLRMPVMTGVEAIRVLKADPGLRSIPILAMSAGTILKAEVQHLPVEGLVDKPFDLDALLARITLQLLRLQRDV
jgi:CheY-like chemotaxis protein